MPRRARLPSWRSRRASCLLWQTRAVLPHAKEGQITLLTEPTSFLPPMADPGSFTSCQGGPDYPPDGAERLAGPRLQAQTVLPHAGRGGLGEPVADRAGLPRQQCPSPPSLTSSRTPTEGWSRPQQAQHQRLALLLDPALQWVT